MTSIATRQTGKLPAEYQEQFDKAMADAAVLKEGADEILALEKGEGAGVGDGGGLPHQNPGFNPGAKGGDGAALVAVRSYDRDRQRPSQYV